jgi:hypothetical protein
MGCFNPHHWEYQDSINHLADGKLKEELLSIPRDRRMLHLAVKDDIFLRELKKRGLEKRIAFFEIYNEINCDYGDYDKGVLKGLIEEANNYLLERHPDILISSDYGRFDPEVLADNTQVIDHHRYTSFIMVEAIKKAGVGKKSFPSAKNRFLQSVLRDDCEEWESFT